MQSGLTRFANPPTTNLFNLIKDKWQERGMKCIENYSQELKKSNLGRHNARDTELSCVTCLNLE